VILLTGDKGQSENLEIAYPYGFQLIDNTSQSTRPFDSMLLIEA
jgi:hypothetical protein